MENIYDIIHPANYDTSSVTYIDNPELLYRVVGLAPYGYSISKCIALEKYHQIDPPFYATDDSNQLYIAHTACYGYILTHIFSRHMIQTTFYTKNFTTAKSIINQIPTFPEFIWDLIHHKIPDWNETAYQISDLLIGFYCDQEGQYQIHGHSVSIDSAHGEVDCDNRSYDHWGRGLFYTMMHLRKQWVN
jgi:hypothetical protein